ncbi:MAG: hypothetical protein ACYCX4_17080 [Bacillota bacterium]
MDATALKLNYYALTVAILTGCLPEIAFDKLDGRRIKKRTEYTQDASDMLQLRESGVTYKDIGEMYGLKKSTVFMRLKRERLAKRQPMSPEQEAIKDENTDMCDMLRNPEAGGSGNLQRLPGDGKSSGGSDYQTVTGKGG